MINNKKKVSVLIRIHSMLKDGEDAVVSHVTVSIIFRTAMIRRLMKYLLGTRSL